MRAWLISEHWTNEPGTDCLDSGRLCEHPYANSIVEKCKGCAKKSRNKACPKRWMLARDSVKEMVRLTNVMGMSRELAQYEVFKQHLGGQWDRRKDYHGRVPSSSQLAPSSSREVNDLSGLLLPHSAMLKITTV